MTLGLYVAAYALHAAMTPMKTGSQLPPANVLLLEDEIQPEFEAKEQYHIVLCLPSSLFSNTHHKTSASGIFFPVNTDELVKVGNEGHWSTRAADAIPV